MLLKMKKKEDDSEDEVDEGEEPTQQTDTLAPLEGALGFRLWRDDDVKDEDDAVSSAKYDQGVLTISIPVHKHGKDIKIDWLSFSKNSKNTHYN